MQLPRKLFSRICFSGEQKERNCLFEYFFIPKTTPTDSTTYPPKIH